jgi:hypothetical protein
MQVIVVQIHANCVLNNGYEKIYEIPFLRLGGAWRNVSPVPPVNFCNSGEMDDMQIAKLVMQIHANYVLIIDSKKNQIFLMGGAGVTHKPISGFN